MNKNKVSRAGFSLILLLASLTLLSCGKKKNSVTSENSLQIHLTDSQSKNIYSKPLNHSFTNKKILVLLGYDFNSDQIAQSILSDLETEFGFYEDDGLIFPLVFPEDFKRNGRSYSTELYHILSDPDIEFGGVVILGAPEYTHLALARNQDLWEQEVPYPVISLFPQDDNLGIESTSDFILDKSQTADISSENSSAADSAEQLEFLKNHLPLIKQTINYIICSDYSIQQCDDVLYHVTRILGEEKFHNYTDPETGLKSINHFVLD